MAKDRVTLRVDDSMRRRIERVREQLDRTVVPGQRGMTFSDAARHCLEVGLAHLEVEQSTAPGSPMKQSTAKSRKSRSSVSESAGSDHQADSDSPDVFDMFPAGS